MFNRPIYNVLRERINEKNPLIQVLVGPRQVGKTTIARQIAIEKQLPTHYASADEPGIEDSFWIAQQWDTVRFKIKTENASTGLLILDEIQKIPNWSETIKRLWDDDVFNNRQFTVILLGSSQLLIQKGLSESLAGRFEVIPIPHWSFGEVQAAFGLTLEEYAYFGGYPGAIAFIKDEERWSNYINHSLIETVLGRDILLFNRINKPALLRRLFQLGCDYSSQIVSYQKMLGQLHDAGNTTTLAHYLELLGAAGLITGLNKFSNKKVQQRASSPKLQVFNTALINAGSGMSFKETVYKRELWGRVIESMIGAHLINEAMTHNFSVFYWRERNHEVDYILQKGAHLIALEVKSGQKATHLEGLSTFAKQFHPTRVMQVGQQGMPIEEFLLLPIQELF